MITLTRPDGQPTALNAVLIERVEATAEATAITLVDGTEYIVIQSVQDVIEKLEHFHASVLASAIKLNEGGCPRPALRLIRGASEG